MNQLYHRVFGCSNWPGYSLRRSIKLASVFDMLPSFLELLQILGDSTGLLVLVFPLHRPWSQPLLQGVLAPFAGNGV